jgi:uncharacterized membrane protein (UPF0127 family)
LQDYSKLHHKFGSREVTLSLGWFLILGLITIIGLDLLPYVVAQAKIENDVPSENYTTLATDSHNVNTLTNKAAALGSLGNYNGAIKYYDKALAIDSHYVYALIGKATALGSLGNYNGAIKYYDKALAIQPNNTYALDSKAAALDNLGNHTGAIKYYDKALAINPKFEAALYNNTFLHEVNKSFPGDNIYLHAKVTVNGFEVRADIALTGEQQGKGLDIKNNLTENQGMFFVFQQPDRYGFWMKGMKFPIDIIWLDRNGTVTHIEHSLKPCPPANSNLVCPTYFPEKDSLYVLETVPGFSMKHNVRLGTHVSFELVK